METLAPGMAYADLMRCGLPRVITTAVVQTLREEPARNGHRAWRDRCARSELDTVDGLGKDGDVDATIQTVTIIGSVAGLMAIGVSVMLFAMNQFSKRIDDTNRRFDDLGGQMREIRGDVREVRSEICEVRSEVRAVRDEVRGEMRAVRGEISEVRGEISEVRGEISEVRGEVREVGAEVRELRGAISPATAGEPAPADASLRRSTTP